MKRSEFVHLHLHSQYSLLDGAIQFKPLFKKLNALKMDAVALTDHGAMFGAVEFCGEAIAAGVRPIVGCEAYVAPASRFDRGPVSSDASTDRSHHLVLLAQDDKGYRNLCALVSAGYLEGFYYKPRVDKELLASHAEGLIALSACLHGEVAANLLHGREDAARHAAGFYKETFPGRFYLEVQDHGLEGQKAVNPRMIALARAMGLPLVATNDAHYLNRDDAEAHDALLCIGTGKSVADPRRLRYDGDQFYVKSEEEMRALFGEIPEALTNTLAIAEQCAFRFEEGKIHLPRFPIPAPDMTIEQFLRQTAVNGLEHRFAEAARRGKPLDDAAKRARMVRLEMELGVISKMGFPGYFLITWDFIRYARETRSCRATSGLSFSMTRSRGSSSSAFSMVIFRSLGISLAILSA
ncbi:MAG: PHP domain-containing protein, partial [Nitrospinae bacterium]|nr:PHP domain-containing protein [Nitrospinota bacterium]